MGSVVSTIGASFFVAMSLDRAFPKTPTIITKIIDAIIIIVFLFLLSFLFVGSTTLSFLVIVFSSCEAGLINVVKSFPISEVTIGAIIIVASSGP